MEYFLSYFKNFLGNATVIFDVEALFSVRDFIGKSELSFKEIDYDAYKKSSEFLNEIEIFKYADVIWFASQLEKLIYEKGIDNPKPAYEVGHFVHHLPSKTQTFDLRQGMVFLGGIPEKASPNADAIRILIKDIIPGLRKSGMNEPFYIMGNIEVPEIEKEITAYCERDPHTYYLGFMDNPEEIIQKARVFVAPSRIAAGIPHKLTLPAKYGVPIVTSGLISQQVFTKDCFKSSHSVEEFIANIETLYRDKAKWSAASEQATNYVRQELNPKNYEAAFTNLIH
jgi:glycosyltransferase involved in cell wall biosynthesis